MSRKDLLALSADDISTLRVRLLDNTARLIDDAELLFGNGRYARSFTLSVIAVEEASKIPYLLECLEKIAAGESLDWSKVHTFLNSHHEKLMANLLQFKGFQSPTRVPERGTLGWEDAVARVRYMNRLKQDSLYVSAGDEGVRAPLETIEQSQADLALRLAKVSFNASDLLGRRFDARRAGKTQVDLRTRYSMDTD